MRAGLPRYIATVETSKHRFFVFLDQSILPDNKLINIASSDPALLASLSSTAHVAWALNCGGRLGFGNDPVYVKTTCFETFPFPDLSADPALQARLAELGEQLDAHRKRQQAAHPALTMTGMYNVLEQLRRGEALDAKERAVHDAGLVSVLKELHDAIDAAVLAAYGWADLQPAGAPPLADRLARGDEQAQALEQDLLSRLVALNHERAAEEARGHIRWLRPEYQASGAASAAPTGEQTELDSGESEAPAAPAAVQHPWPAEMKDQFTLLRGLAQAHGADPEKLLARLQGKRTAKRRREVGAVLTALQAMGLV